MSRMTSKPAMSTTQRSTMRRISKISYSQSRHILPTLTLDPRGEFSHTMAFPKASTFKPKPITPDAVMNMMHQTTNASMKTYPAYPADLHAHLVVQWRRQAPGFPKSWPVSPILDLDPKSGPSDLSVLPKVLV